MRKFKSLGSCEFKGKNLMFSDFITSGRFCHIVDQICLSFDKLVNIFHVNYETTSHAIC
jgi:hypothetical protein